LGKTKGSLSVFSSPVYSRCGVSSYAELHRKIRNVIVDALVQSRRPAPWLEEAHASALRALSDEAS
jgi:hypothetical protein